MESCLQDTKHSENRYKVIFHRDLLSIPADARLIEVAFFHSSKEATPLLRTVSPTIFKIDLCCTPFTEAEVVSSLILRDPEAVILVDRHGSLWRLKFP